VKEPHLRLVAPFKPFPPETGIHQRFGMDYWLDALEMLDASAQLSTGRRVYALTDRLTPLPIPALRYDTTETRLMLWLLQVCLAYLRSDEFDRDTVMLDVDQLVVKPLAPYLPDADLGVCVRHHVKGMPLLNGVQFWRVRGKDRLAQFYQKVLDVARAMPESEIRWGADGHALLRCLQPLEIDYQLRSGVRVAFIPATRIIEEWSSLRIEQANASGFRSPVIDFRGRHRKHHHRTAFELWRETQAVPV